MYKKLQPEILKLDDCVTEEFLKIYVAYKAETNFVDITPMANSLKLTLNLKFHELYDPRGLAKNVTGISWANGDAEINLQQEEQVPYVLGLIRQALEKQMGGEPD